MPVTTKLSQKFYERLGDDIANELVDWFNQVDMTYRNDLRELNELNFQRFDAKLEHRVTASEARLDNRITELRADMQVGFANLERKLETRSANMETAFASLQRDLEKSLRAQVKWMFGFWLVTLVPLAGLIITLDRLRGG